MKVKCCIFDTFYIGQTVIGPKLKVCFFRTINIIRSSIVHGSEHVLAGSESIRLSDRGEIIPGR